MMKHNLSLKSLYLVDLSSLTSLFIWVLYTNSYESSSLYPPSIYLVYLNSFPLLTFPRLLHNKLVAFSRNHIYSYLTLSCDVNFDLMVKIGLFFSYSIVSIFSLATNKQGVVIYFENIQMSYYSSNFYSLILNPVLSHKMLFSLMMFAKGRFLPLH